MGARGRKPTPPELKILKGDRNKARINTATPKAPAGPIQPMEEVANDPEALEQFNKVCTHLGSLGLLSPVFETVANLSAVAWARWRRFDRELLENGAVLYSEKGNPTKNPAAAEAQYYLNLQMKCLAEMGLTPSAKGRIVSDGPPQKSPLEKFRLRGG